MDKNILSNISKPLTEFWSNKSKADRKKLIIIAIIILALLVTSTLLLTRKTYAQLYTNLESQDAGEIMVKLEELKVDAKTEGSNTILVPEQDVDRLRMELAAQGFPKSGYDLSIIEKGSGFGATESDKQVYRQYQLQLNLESAIKTMENIEDAKVIFTIPDESLYVISSDKQSATAAVLLTLSDNAEISSKNVKAIAELVQKSVPGLKMEDISIVDSKMNILSTNSSTENLDVNDKFEYKTKLQQSLSKQILSLLQPVFGIGNVLSEVSVSLDFSDRSTESVKYEPVVNGDSGIIVSIDKIREQTTNGASGGATGVDANGAATTYPVVGTDNSVYVNNSETVNYEINTIKESVVSEKGKITDMTVSVLIDSLGTDQDYSDNIKTLVAATVGIDSAKVVVQRMPFTSRSKTAETMAKQQVIEADSIKSNQNWNYIKLATIAGVVLVLVISVLRLLFKKNAPAYSEAEAQQNIGRQVDFAADEELDLGEFSLDNKKPNKNPIVKQKEEIENFVETDPETVANLLRNWISDNR